MNRRTFISFVVLAVAVPFGIAMAALNLPPLVAFALGLPAGALTYLVADQWWESQH